MLSRIDDCRSFLRRGSTSRLLDAEDALSRVRTLSSPDMLFSLRTAAVSRSGQSDRLTNSYCGSPTSSTCWVDPFRREAEELGRLKSKGLGSSATGVVADSLKRSRDAATLRPMPEDCVGGAFHAGLLDEDEEEAEEERRDRGLAGRGEVWLRSAETVREEGRVNDRSVRRVLVFRRT